MKLGMIGLGRMGADMVRRLRADGHEVVVYDLNPDAVAGLVDEGATGTDSLAALAAALDPPRVAWIMVPAGVVGATIDALSPHLAAGDIVVDGGNSYYRDDIERAATFAASGIHWVDVGVSGGVWGREQGYCLMIGGAPEIAEYLDPVFRSLAPGVDMAPRTPGREGEPSRSEHGYLHCGPSGAGHFVKMVHNGIEYGMMAAFAEGLAILERADVGSVAQRHDAETAPLGDPRHYQFDIDTAAVAEVWRRGSVIHSWLLDLAAAALVADPRLAGFSGHVSDSGEGRWTVQAAVDEGVPAPVISAALFARFSSRGEGNYAARVLSAMRSQFGGHAERPPADG